MDRLHIAAQSPTDKATNSSDLSVVAGTPGAPVATEATIANGALGVAVDAVGLSCLDHVIEADNDTADPAPVELNPAIVEQLEPHARKFEREQSKATLRLAHEAAKIHETLRYYRVEGGYAGYMKDRLGRSRSSAYRLLDIHKRFGANPSHIWDRFPPTALSQLASASIPQEAVDAVAARVKAGEKPSCAMVTEAIAKAKHVDHGDVDHGDVDHGDVDHGAATEATVERAGELPGAPHDLPNQEASERAPNGSDAVQGGDAADTSSTLSQPTATSSKPAKTSTSKGKKTTEADHTGEGNGDDPAASAERRKAECAALEFLEAMAPEVRQVLAEKIFAEFFSEIAAAAEKDITAAKKDPEDPSKNQRALDQYKKTCHAFLEALGVDGFCQIMPQKFREQLNSRMRAKPGTWLADKKADEIAETIEKAVGKYKASAIRALLPVMQAPKPRAEVVKPKKVKSKRASKRISKRNGKSDPALNAKPTGTTDAAADIKPVRPSDPETLLKNSERLSTQEIEDQANAVRRLTGRGTHLSQAQWKRLHVMEDEVKARRKTKKNSTN